MKKQIEIKKIKKSFFTDNSYLVETIDDKDRGYGYVSCLIDGYHFAIPLRSSIKHNHCFRISTPPDSKGSKGLDYTKALIIDPKYLGDPFVIDNREYQKIFRNQTQIVNEFIEYVDNYKKYKNNEQLADEYIGAYIFTTLINYHAELDI